MPRLFGLTVNCRVYTDFQLASIQQQQLLWHDPELRIFHEASVSDSQKRSILLPVIKEGGLDQSDPVNYRPIANVTFLSKILERIVANQLITYLD